ncbi:Fructose-1,6-bisphosphatase isozyme 2 [Rhizophlyctis rosea]|nr:Fructose-1,6-bisphosphatase isozyme 2 [Rhizophlyctis rosea]
MPVVRPRGIDRQDGRGGRRRGGGGRGGDGGAGGGGRDRSRRDERAHEPPSRPAPLEPSVSNGREPSQRSRPPPGFGTQLSEAPRAAARRNESGHCNAHTLDEAIKGYINSVKFPPPGHQEKFTPYTAYYVGSMVADIHRTLLYGGIFLYPGGELRVLYEFIPMALLIEAAGGKASTTGRRCFLDLTPDNMHSRSPIVLGTKEESEAVEEWYTTPPCLQRERVLIAYIRRRRDQFRFSLEL